MCRFNKIMNFSTKCLFKVSCLFLVLLGMVPFASGSNQIEVKTISFWHTMNSNKNFHFKVIISEFESLNPNIRIDLQQVPFSDAQNKYKIAAGAGDAPDVFRSEIAWIADFAELGFLVPLENSIDKKELNDFLDAALTYGRYKGHLWALPQVTDCLALLPQ